MTATNTENRRGAEHPPRRVIEAFFALIGFPAAIKAVCDSEFQAWIDDNEHRAKLPADQIAKQRHHARLNTLGIMRNLRWNLIGSLLLLASACVLGLILANFAVGRTGTPSTRALLALSSAAVFAWATLAKLGWRQESWGGRTIFETLDRLLFRALYWIGTFLATLSIIDP